MAATTSTPPNGILPPPSRSLTASTTASALSTEQVRELQLHECKAAAYTLAQAFAQDDVARYFIDTPDLAHWTPKQKWDLHLSILEYITYIHCVCGTVTAVGADYDCVALCANRLPPGRNADSFVALIRSGLWRLHYKLSREGRWRFFREFMPLLHDTKLSVLGPKHDADSYYLVYLGTKPGSRGQGLARRCMEWGMHRADAENKLCYLESSNTINLKIYSRMGFVKKRQIKLVRDVAGHKTDQAGGPSQIKGEILLDIMVREPLTAG